MAANTLYVIAYDISSDKRRARVHKILSGYGQWTQFSLFEVFLSEKELVALKGKLARYLKEKEDSVRFYPLCAGCVGKVFTVGGEPPAEPQLYLI